MRIITASSAAVARGELPRHHPTQSLFTITPLKASDSDITLRLHWRHPDPKTRSAVRGALGCVVDYAARLAAQSLLGDCDLSECELHVCRSFEASTLLAVTRINVVHDNCATYQCEIYVRKSQQNVLVAHSEGTALKRADELSRFNPSSPEVSSL